MQLERQSSAGRNRTNCSNVCLGSAVSVSATHVVCAAQVCAAQMCKHKWGWITQAVTPPNSSSQHTERWGGHMTQPLPMEKHRCRCCETWQYRSENLLNVNYSFFFFFLCCFSSTSFLFHYCQIFFKVNSIVPYGPPLDESLVLYV